MAVLVSIMSLGLFYRYKFHSDDAYFTSTVPRREKECSNLYKYLFYMVPSPIANDSIIDRPSLHLDKIIVIS